MPDRVLYSVTFGFLSGVLLGFDWYFGIYTSVALLCGTVYFGFLRETDFLLRSLVTVVVVFFCATGLGFIRFVSVKVAPPRTFESRVGQTVTLTSTISDDPTLGDGTAVTVLHSGSIGFRTKIKTGTVIAYGDTVTVSGTLAKPENFETSQGTEFDYVDYLAKDNIFYLIQNAQLRSITKATSFSLTRTLYSFRHSVERILFTYLPEREGGFVAGILLGTKADIAQDFYDDLVRTSTVHIIALSGYNVTIVAESIAAVLGVILAPVAASIVGGIGIVLFVIMTGASSTALRAGLMALLLIFARVSGRQSDAFRVLTFAALILIAIRPSYLTSDVSFQLSFLATLGLLLVSPLVVGFLERFLPFVFAELIGTTLAAEISVAPFIIYKMGVFSVVSLPTNVLILPFIPILMFLGFILICIGFAVPWFGGVIGYPTYIVGQGIMNAISFSAHLPFAAVTIPSVPLLLILLFYTGLTRYCVSKALTRVE
jgi:competence protein ComEC